MPGYRMLCARFRASAEVGETTPDGKFSLDCLRCVGACGLAPVVMIGEHVYGRLDVKDVRQILENVASQD